MILGSMAISELPKLNNATNQSSLIPAVAWLRSYPRQWLRADVTAGLTAAAVVIPKAMATATVAGSPLQVGLYTAFVPMVIYALLGTSRPLSVSATTTIAILSGAELGELAPDGGGRLIIAGATLALLVGAMLVLASVAPRLRRELHLRTGPGRIQSRDRARHRRRSDPEAARVSHPQSRVLPRPGVHRSAAAAHLRATLVLACPVHADLWVGALPAAAPAR